MYSTSVSYSEGSAIGGGYIEARTDTTQQSGQTPDREVEIRNIAVYVSGYTETVGGDNFPVVSVSV
jgi:hypothetical protein